LLLLGLYEEELGREELNVNQQNGRASSRSLPLCSPTLEKRVEGGISYPARQQSPEKSDHCALRPEREDVMSIPKVLPVDDPRWSELIEFISGRLQEIGSGMEMQGIVNDAGKRLEEGSEETDDWYEGYLAAFNDIVVFIQRLHSSAAA
jgi:hypothetical protein